MHMHRVACALTLLLPLLAACSGGGEPGGKGSRPPAARAAGGPRPSAETPSPAAPSGRPEVPVEEFRDEGLVPSAAMAVYHLLKQTGVSTAAFARIQRELVGDMKGIRVRHVLAYLEKAGFPAGAAPVGPESLVRSGGPALVLLRTKRTAAEPRTGRFAFLRGRAGEGILLVDPTEGLRTLAPAAFRQRYLGVAVTLRHPRPRPAREAPDLVVDEMVWNFGEVATGTVVEHSFRVRNGGARPLKIDRVETTCGCAAAMVRDKARARVDPKQAARGGMIPPGGEAWVAARVDTRGKEGYQNFRITLVTNDPEEPQFYLSLQGRIVRVFELEPLTLWFPEVYAARGVTDYLWVRHHQARAFRITELKTSSPHLEAALDPDPPREAPPTSTIPGVRPRAHPAAAGWQGIRVRLKPGLPVGTFSGMVSFKADGTPMSAHVAAIVKGNLEVEPAYFAFGHVRKGEARAATVTVTSRVPAGFVVRRAEVDRDFMAVSVQPAGAGTYRVTVRLKEGWQAYDLRGTVTLYTNDPLEPKKQVLVFGFVRPDEGE